MMNFTLSAKVQTIILLALDDFLPKELNIPNPFYFYSVYLASEIIKSQYEIGYCNLQCLN